MARSLISTEIISMVLDEIPLTDKLTLFACCFIFKAVYLFARARMYQDPPIFSFDVFAEILNHIEVEDRATLCACALTSKDFLPLARARLYRRLSFAIAGDNGAGITEITDSNVSSLLTPSSSQLHTSLRSCPKFGAHVKVAQIDFDGYPVPACSDAVQASLLQFLLGRCLRLSALRLGTARADEHLSNKALAKLGSQLRMLDFTASRSIGLIDSRC